MVSNLASCIAFLKAHQFVEQGPQRYYHSEADLWVFYLENQLSSKDEALTLQQEVLNNRKQDANIWVIRASVWEARASLIQRMLQAKLKKLIAVFARDLRLELVSEPTAKEFLTANHLLGFSKGKWYVAIVVPPHRRYRFSQYPEIVQANNGLLAIAIFGKTLIRNRTGVEGMRSLEWIRLATIPSIRLVGGLSKLFDFIQEKEAFDDIMTYVDVESNDARGLQRFGFRLEEITQPIDLPSGFNLGNYKLRYVR